MAILTPSSASRHISPDYELRERTSKPGPIPRALDACPGTAGIGSAARDVSQTRPTPSPWAHCPRLPVTSRPGLIPPLPTSASLLFPPQTHSPGPQVLLEPAKVVLDETDLEKGAGLQSWESGVLGSAALGRGQPWLPGCLPAVTQGTPSPSSRGRGRMVKEEETLRGRGLLWPQGSP